MDLEENEQRVRSVRAHRLLKDGTWFGWWHKCFGWLHVTDKRIVFEPGSHGHWFDLPLKRVANLSLGRRFPFRHVLEVTSTRGTTGVFLISASEVGMLASFVAGFKPAPSHVTAHASVFRDGDKLLLRIGGSARRRGEASDGEFYCLQDRLVFISDADDPFILRYQDVRSVRRGWFPFSTPFLTLTTVSGDRVRVATPESDALDLLCSLLNDPFHCPARSLRTWKTHAGWVPQQLPKAPADDDDYITILPG
jgi:hypothetical protein